MEKQRRVKFSVEVRSGSARFRVGVRARSVREGLRLVGGRYQQGVVEVAFPKVPEGLFANRRTHELAA